MQRREMTPEQLEQVELFVAKLSARSWDEVERWHQLLQGGTSASPPAFGRHVGAAANFEIGLWFEDEYAKEALDQHVPGTYLKFLIGSKDLERSTTFRLYHGDRLGDVLDLVVDNQDTLSLDNFADAFMSKVLPLCEQVVLEVGDGQFMKVE